MFQLPHSPQFFEKQRRLFRTEQCLFHFQHHAFSRKGRQVDTPAEFHRFRRHRKLKPCRKLCRPQHPQRILCKCHVVHMPEYAVLQVLPAAEMIDDLAGQHVLHQCIHGEVPPFCRFIGAQKRVRSHGKVTVSHAGTPFGTGQGNVQRVSFQTVNAEAFPDFHTRSQFGEQLFQCFGGNAVHFNVNILVFQSEKPVTHTAADKIHCAALLRRLFGNGSRQFRICHDCTALSNRRRNHASRSVFVIAF